MEIDEKIFNELEKCQKVLEVRRQLEKIAKNAIDQHLIHSWYYNGKSFVIIFKMENE